MIAGVDGPYDVTTATFGDDPTEAVVVTDTNLLFGMAVDLVRLMRIPALVPPVVVVGVGYRRRSRRDPPPSHHGLHPDGGSGWPGSGGGAGSRTMLREHVLPVVASVAPTVRDLTLFGHSLGGMFSVTDWMAEDRLFDRYVISSPSLWWDDHALLRESVPVPRAPAYLAIGSEGIRHGRRHEAAALPEGDRWKPPAMYLDMVDDLLRFVACLTPADDRDAPPVDIIDGEFHATVPPLRVHPWASPTAPRTGHAYR